MNYIMDKLHKEFSSYSDIFVFEFCFHSDNGTSMKTMIWISEIG